MSLQPVTLESGFSKPESGGLLAFGNYPAQALLYQ
jgi:hypothetical protein